MAEAKNTFIKSKMNKDLDDRLIHNQEYRDAQNVAVSRSEDADVGALENVLGNISVTDFGFSESCNVDIIGKYVDLDNNRIFAFLTNFIDTSADRLSTHANIDVSSPTTYSFEATCCIAVYNVNTTSYNILVSGKFLNFSKTHIITGVNLIENLLFWTDNRNQPRKINVDSALSDPSYYTIEHQISVAKYYPNSPISLLRTETLTVGGVTYSNQLLSTMRDTTTDLLPNNDSTSAATKNPYGPSNLGANWEGDRDFLKDKFVRFSYRLKFDDNEYSLLAPFTQICFVPMQDGYFLAKNNQTSGVPDQEDIKVAYKDTEVRFMKNKVTQIALMIPPPSTTAISASDRTWAKAWDNFRVKEIEIVYKESDGLALHVVDTIDKDEFTTATTIAADNYALPYIYNSEKPYKVLPNDEITRVSDRAPLRAQSQEVSGNRVIYGNFVDKATPPASINYSATSAVKGALQSDGTANPSAITDPLRIEYQNHTLKQLRSYDVGIVLSDLYGRQSDVVPTSNYLQSANTVFHEYKQSGFSDSIATGNLYSSTDTWPGDCLRAIFYSQIPETTGAEGYPGLWSESNPLGWYSYKIVVKQNEQEYYNVYFPGVLLGTTSFSGGTAPTADFPIGHIMLHGDNINKIPRDLTEVGPEQKLFRSGEKKETMSLDTLTLGLLIPSITEDSNSDPSMIENSSVEIYPRVYNRSNVNTRQAYPFTSGIELKPDEVVTIGTLTDMGEAATVATGAAISNTNFYEASSNPLIARIRLQDITNGVTEGTMLPVFSVYETKPIRSNIDIYWETSTCGIISELNTAIATNNIEECNGWGYLNNCSGTANQAFFNTDTVPKINTVTWTEAKGGGFALTDDFVPAYGPSGGVPGAGFITDNTVVLAKAVNGKGDDVTNLFTLTSSQCGSPTQVNVYKINTAASPDLWYRADPLYNQFTFTMKVTENTSGIVTMKELGPLFLQNAIPTVNPSGATSVSITTSGGLITKITGTNGSASSTSNKQELTFTIQRQIDSLGQNVKFFYLGTQSTLGSIDLYAKNGTTAGTYTVNVRVTDGGNAFVDSGDITITVT